MILHMTRYPASTNVPSGIHLRAMQEADLPEVYALEVISQPAPWPRWFFRRQLRSGASCWVLEAGKQIVAFGIVAFVKDLAHIMNMCVAPDYRRRGLGRRIMLRLLGIARQRHCRGVWLEVRPTNRAAILLYRELGFRQKQVIEAYYPSPGGRRNALYMARALRPRPPRTSAPASHRHISGT
jgi:ribosomal-protein-alanine N-acetyltransferase